MKKLLVLLLVLSLIMLCGCKNTNQDDVVDPTLDPDATGSQTADPTENVTIDWETPIDIDDSFLQETEDEATEPEDEETPTEGETTSGQNDPTEPDPTEADPTESASTPAESEPVETTKPNSGSRPIELPMVPG